MERVSTRAHTFAAAAMHGRPLPLLPPLTAVGPRAYRCHASISEGVPPEFPARRGEDKVSDAYVRAVRRDPHADELRVRLVPEVLISLGLGAKGENAANIVAFRVRLRRTLYPSLIPYDEVRHRSGHFVAFG